MNYARTWNRRGEAPETAQLTLLELTREGTWVPRPSGEDCMRWRGWARVRPERVEKMVSGRKAPKLVHRVYPSGWARPQWRSWLKWPMGNRNGDSWRPANDAAEARSIAEAVAPTVRVAGRVTLWGLDAGPLAKRVNEALAETVTGASLDLGGGRRMAPAALLEAHGYRVSTADSADWTSGAEAEA